MNPVYVETSAIGRAYFHGDNQTRNVIQAALKHHHGVTSALTPIELQRTSLNLMIGGGSSPPTHGARQRTLQKLLKRIHIIEMDDRIRRRAGERYLVEPVRTLDAIHLATILDLQEESGGNVVVITRDRRIRDNALAYGIPLL